MKSFLPGLLFIIIFSTTTLMAQSDIKKLIYKELSGDHGFIPDNIPGSVRDNIFGSIPNDNSPSNPLKAYANEPGIKKSANEDLGDTPDWIWVKQFGGNTSDVGTAVTSDAMGNIYVAGYFSGITVIGDDTLESTGKADMVILKLSQTCFPLWYKHIPSSEGTSIIPESIFLDNSGNIIITGYFNGSTITIGGTVLNRIGNQDIFLSKLSSSGNFTWSKSYGESTRLLGGSKVKSDASNNYYIICNEGIPYSKLIKYNTSGQLTLNLYKYNCKYNDIEIFNNTDLYLTGIVNGMGIVFGDSILNAGVSSIFLAKGDLSGNFSWAISAGCTE
jgi:hypothetical protein